MDNEITAAVSFFDGIQMDDRCSRRIAAAMDARRAAPLRREEYTMRQPEEDSRFGWIGAAACLLLMLICAGWFLGKPDPAPVQMTEPTATTETVRIKELTPQEDWLYRYSEEEGGNIYLTLQDSWFDITEELSFEEPVIYCYEPVRGRIDFYALGLSDCEEGLGWYYNIYTEESGWGPGTASGQLDAGGEEYAWYTLALEKQQAHLLALQREGTERVTPHGPRPAWLAERDGKLYFIGNREEIDISNAFSDEEPFLYTYSNAAGIEVCIAVGGTYIPGNDLDTVGWTEMTKDLILEENLAARFRCWRDGYGRGHWNNAEDREYGWYTAAKEAFGWSWS